MAHIVVELTTVCFSMLRFMSQKADKRFVSQMPLNLIKFIPVHIERCQLKNSTSACLFLLGDHTGMALWGSVVLCGNNTVLLVCHSGARLVYVK